MGDLKSIETRLSALERQVSKLEESLSNRSDRLLLVENTQNVILEKLENVSKQTETIVGMSYKMEDLTEKLSDVLDLIKKQEEKIHKQSKRIDELEKKPGKIALSTMTFIISTVASTGIGTVIGILIKEVIL